MINLDQITNEMIFGNTIQESKGPFLREGILANISRRCNNIYNTIDLIETFTPHCSENVPSSIEKNAPSNSKFDKNVSHNLSQDINMRKNFNKHDFIIMDGRESISEGNIKIDLITFLINLKENEMNVN